MRDMKKIKKIISIFFLLIPPLILSLYVFYLEYQTIDYPSFEIEGGFMEPHQFQDALVNAKDRYEFDKKNFPLNLPNKIVAEQITDYINFNKQIKETFTSRLGVFSLLPIYRACLKNNNIISTENEKLNTKNTSVGATGIVFERNSEYKFYASVGDKDCKYIFKNRLAEDRFRIEHGYAILTEIGPEDKNNILEGKPYRIYVREFKIDTSSSYFFIRLSLWVVFLGYFLLLVAWSYLFFQFIKIIKYLIKAIKGVFN